jgi:uncharacterized protein YjbJ (UPF0337 family)
MAVTGKHEDRNQTRALHDRARAPQRRRLAEGDVQVGGGAELVSPDDAAALAAVVLLHRWEGHPLQPLSLLDRRDVGGRVEFLGPNFSCATHRLPTARGPSKSMTLVMLFGPANSVCLRMSAIRSQTTWGGAEISIDSRKLVTTAPPSDLPHRARKPAPSVRRPRAVREAVRSFERAVDPRAWATQLERTQGLEEQRRRDRFAAEGCAFRRPLRRHVSPSSGYGTALRGVHISAQMRGGPTMGAGDKARHAGEKAKGKAEEVVGKATDNPTKTGHGQRKQTKADLKQAGEKTKDALK